MNIYSIKDEALSRFMQPFFTHTNAAAIRAFKDHVNEKGSAPNAHPGDYTLYFLGVFDEERGCITATFDTGERLINGADLIDKPNITSIRKEA